MHGYQYRQVYREYLWWIRIVLVIVMFLNLYGAPYHPITLALPPYHPITLAYRPITLPLVPLNLPPYHLPPYHPVIVTLPSYLEWRAK